MTAHISIPPPSPLARSRSPHSYVHTYARMCISVNVYMEISRARSLTARPVLRAKQRPTFRTRRKLADGGLSSRRSPSRLLVPLPLFTPPSSLSFSPSLGPAPFLPFFFFFFSRKFLESQRGEPSLRIDVSAPDSYQPGISRIRDGKRNDTDCST